MWAEQWMILCYLIDIRIISGENGVCDMRALTGSTIDVYFKHDQTSTSTSFESIVEPHIYSWFLSTAKKKASNEFDLQPSMPSIFFAIFYCQCIPGNDSSGNMNRNSIFCLALRIRAKSINCYLLIIIIWNRLWFLMSAKALYRCFALVDTWNRTRAECKSKYWIVKCHTFLTHQWIEINYSQLNFHYDVQIQ